jgi:S1-C subfamily serine protease
MASSIEGGSARKLRTLVYDVRDTVVSITVQFERQNWIRHHRGNGVLIKGHYILCPAHLVLPLPLMEVDTTRILVGISNIRSEEPKKHAAYSYEAELMGGDYRANLAILTIKRETPWNQHNPPLTAHPTLSWGKSRNLSPGDPVLIIGDINIDSEPQGGPREGSENGVIVTNIADNRYVSYDGSIPGELLLLAATQSVAPGSPVISWEGAFVGMVVPSRSHRIIALSEFFIRRPIRALIKSSLEQIIPLKYTGLVSTVGPQYRYNKSWLGLGGVLMTQDDFITILSVGPDASIRKQLAPNASSGPKEIVGYRITYIAGGNPPRHPSYEARSPLVDVIHIGDLVTNLNGCPLGDRRGQISPSLIMWRVKPQAEVTLEYRKQCENFEILHTVSMPTLPYNQWDDYPWYAVGPTFVDHILI